MDFRTLSVTELARKVRTRELSAREVAQAALERIELVNPTINAFVAVDGERAMEQAAAVDQVIASGADAGALAGVPLGVKDSEDAAGYRTTFGSTLRSGVPIAVHDSTLVARLRAAGAVVVGKTNLPEFAWTGHTTNSLFGTTANPWEHGHSAGGSSGGSAAAVASGMVPLATGSDGGGSIRIPSACCGLSGMKPSHDRVPAGEHGAGWLGLSAKGVLGLRVADVTAALDVAVGPEPTDLRSLPRPDMGWLPALGSPRLPARVAWSPALGYTDVDRGVLAVCERALDALDALGIDVVEVPTVFDEDPLDDWLTIVGACLARTLEPHEMRMDEVTHGLAALVEQARSTSAAKLVQALDRCYALNRRLVARFHDVRLLVTPTTAGPPPPSSLAGRGLVNGVIDANWVRLTYPFNMTRSPVATVCAGLTPDGLPIGVQLVGPQHADLVVLRSAAALESAIGFDVVAPM